MLLEVIDQEPNQLTSPELVHRLVATGQPQASKEDWERARKSLLGDGVLRTGEGGVVVLTLAARRTYELLDF